MRTEGANPVTEERAFREMQEAQEMHEAWSDHIGQRERPDYYTPRARRNRAIWNKATFEAGFQAGISYERERGFVEGVIAMTNPDTERVVTWLRERQYRWKDADTLASLLADALQAGRAMLTTLGPQEPGSPAYISFGAAEELLIRILARAEELFPKEASHER